ncbi:A24 family peptidase [Paenibacillus campi]|uniref:A24 family peptidase n=1 Tax=Paenibacillus campi TaxID=3106031 RepID=UPI002AFF1A8B|nr:A24 family peptidase [Paenibacillus sp. SGZ-1009]
MEMIFIGSGIFILWACWTDICTRKIPNLLNLIFVLSGLLYHIMNAGLNGIWFASKGIVLGFGIMLLLHMMRAVGAGDVKLFAGIGAWFGIAMTAQVMMYSILFAGLIGIVIMIWRRETIVRMRTVLWRISGALLWKQPLRPDQIEQQQYLTFPFMTAVLPGVIFCYLYV